MSQTEQNLIQLSGLCVNVLTSDLPDSFPKEAVQNIKYSFDVASYWSALKALVSNETLPPEYKYVFLLLQLNQRGGIKHPECSHMLTKLQSKLCQLV